MMSANFISTDAKKTAKDSRRKGQYLSHPPSNANLYSAQSSNTIFIPPLFPTVTFHREHFERDTI